MNKSDRKAAIIKMLTRIKKARERLDDLKHDLEKLQRKFHDCDHSVTDKFTWEHDNGYGRQSLNNGLICKLCGKRCYYPTLSSSWIYPDGRRM